MVLSCEAQSRSLLPTPLTLQGMPIIQPPQKTHNRLKVFIFVVCCIKLPFKCVLYCTPLGWDFVKFASPKIIWCGSWGQQSICIPGQGFLAFNTATFPRFLGDAIAQKYFSGGFQICDVGWYGKPLIAYLNLRLLSQSGDAQQHGKSPNLIFFILINTYILITIQLTLNKTFPADCGR